MCVCVCVCRFVLDMAQRKCLNQHQKKSNGLGTLDRLRSKSMESFGDISDSCHNIVWANNMKGWPLKVERDMLCSELWCAYIYIYIYSVCVYLCMHVCFMKIENGLAQVLYILFSYFQQHQMKQITLIKINRSVLFITIIKSNTKESSM